MLNYRVVSQSASVNIDPSIVDSLKGLQLVAKHLAKGLISGKHMSKKLGQGLEFEQYRQYVQGDDIRALDWKMYAKTGKYYIRQATIETENYLHLHIDNSPSMNYSEQKMSKMSMVKIITATLSYIAVSQGDKFSIATNQIIASKNSGWKKWNQSLQLLQSMTTSNLEKPKSLLSQEGIHIFLSDLYHSIDDIKSFIDQVIGKNRSLTIIHLIGHDEENLNFGNNANFIDLESNDQVRLNPEQYRSEYKLKLSSHIRNIESLCASKKVVLKKVYLKDDLRQAIRSILSSINPLVK